MTNQHSSSRRSLLAALWSIVGLLTLTSFVIAILFAYASKKYDEANSYNNNNNEDNNNYNYNNGDNYNNNGNYNNNRNNYNYNEAQQQQQSWSQQQGSAISVTSRAMVFAAIWTAVLSGILVIYGTVILGVRMPITGKYYACCAGNVHRMTPLSLGAFGGSLLMFANLTLVCAILFGEFEIRDFNFGASQQKEDQNNNNNANDDDDASNDRVVDQSSFAFSIMCIFFTVMYAAFAALVFYNSNALLEESVADARDELLSSSGPGSHHTAVNNAPGYFGGDRFGVSRSYATNKGTKNIEVM